MTSTTALKVILFTDLVGSTDMKRRLGDREGARLISAHNELFRTCLAACNGIEQDNAGDGFCCLFDRPSDALRCALDFQIHLGAMDLGTPLSVRIGIHMGEAVTMGQKLVGLAMDLTARVMGLAIGGQILITRGAFDSVRQQLVGTDDDMPIAWLAHGPYRMKGIDEPIDIFEVGVPNYSPLRPPPDSEKAFRAVAPGEEDTLGWRPAVGLEIPNRAQWKLERKLGDGAFGEVWLARHARLKECRTFKFCFDAEKLRALKRELQLFSLMKEALGERPDIAKLYDVKLDAAPYYLEMQYTEGGNLREWAERHGGLNAIPMNIRMEVVAQVAEAVGAAHSIGVIHKDIKPSNILIEEPRHGAASPPNLSGRPLQIRLIDFGIGQVLTRALGDSVLTGTGSSTGGSRELTAASHESGAGTHMYMSPEVHAGRPSSIQSDIYALGVLLYQVAVGDLARPIGHGWESEITDEILRSDIAACVIGEPRARLASADELARRLRTLDKRREDLTQERIKRDREIRHRRLWRVGMGASAVFAMVSVVAGVGWFTTQREARAKEAEAAKKELEAQKTLAVLEVLVTAIESVDPDEHRADTGVVDLLAPLAQKINMIPDPVIVARFQSRIGTVYKRWSRISEALANLRPALDVQRKLLGERHADTAKTLLELGGVLVITNELVDAHKMLADALAAQKSVHGESHEEVARALNYTATALQKQKEYSRAELMFKQAIDMRKKCTTNEPWITAGMINNLAKCIYDEGRVAEASECFASALRIVEEIDPPDTVHLAKAYGTYALFLTDKNDFEGAENHLKLALEMQIPWYKTDVHTSVATTLRLYAMVLLKKGDLDGAMSRCKRSIEILTSLNANEDLRKSERVMRDIESAQHNPASSAPASRAAVVQQHG